MITRELPYTEPSFRQFAITYLAPYPIPICSKQIAIPQILNQNESYQRMYPLMYRINFKFYKLWN